MSRLRHRLFGYRDQSNYNRYEYERKGLLSGAALLHLRRGVVVVPLHLGKAAHSLVTEEKARAWLRKVELEPGDWKKMAQVKGQGSKSRKGVKRASKRLRKRK